MRIITQVYNAVFILRGDMDMVPPKANESAIASSCLHQANISNRRANGAFVSRKLTIINDGANGDKLVYSDNRKFIPPVSFFPYNMPKIEKLQLSFQVKSTCKIYIAVSFVLNGHT